MQVKDFIAFKPLGRDLCVKKSGNIVQKIDYWSSPNRHRLLVHALLSFEE